MKFFWNYRNVISTNHIVFMAKMCVIIFFSLFLSMNYLLRAFICSCSVERYMKPRVLIRSLSRSNTLIILRFLALYEVCQWYFVSECFFVLFFLNRSLDAMNNQRCVDLLLVLMVMMMLSVLNRWLCRWLGIPFCRHTLPANMLIEHLWSRVELT